MEYFQSEQADVQTAQAETRIIRGLIMPFNKIGRTSRGPVSVDTGAVSWSQNLRTVKLLDGHRASDGTAVSVGYLQDIQVTDEGLVATFKVGTNDISQTALQNAIDGTVDAMSVELDNLEFSSDGKRITRATLSAVALVPIPAFSEARISEVVAQNVAHDGINEKEQIMEPNESATPEVVAPAVIAPAEAAQAPAPAVQAAQAPVGLGSAQVKKETLSLHRVSEILQGSLHSGSTTADLTAALADITRSANPLVSPDAWVGELWSGVSYQRTFVPLLTQRPLTSWKVTGWKWTVKPAVAPYAGDKAAIPTNAADTTSVEVSAQRLAGGHDIDRKFIDFNDSEFIESYFRAMAESYAQQSDLVALNAIIAAATTPVVAPAGSSLLKQVAYGINDVRTTTRTNPSFVLVNNVDFTNLIGITDQNVPAFLSLLGVNPASFVPTDQVAPGVVVVGAQPAMTFYELAGSPIRVQAEHLSNGGRDAAVFGYVATLLHDTRGIVSVANAA